MDGRAIFSKDTPEREERKSDCISGEKLNHGADSPLPGGSASFEVHRVKCKIKTQDLSKSQGKNAAKMTPSFPFLLWSFKFTWLFISHVFCFQSRI